MTDRLVCDASAVVALLTDSGPDGTWAYEVMSGADLAAPTVLAYEVANVLRRIQLSGLLDPGQLTQAHADLLAMSVEAWPYEVVAERIWELRDNLPSYDASYVAVAELSGRTLVTLDRRLTRAPGLRCPTLTPP